MHWHAGSAWVSVARGRAALRHLRPPCPAALMATSRRSTANTMLVLLLVWQLLYTALLLLLRPFQSRVRRRPVSRALRALRACEPAPIGQAPGAALPLSVGSSRC